MVIGIANAAAVRMVRRWWNDEYEEEEVYEDECEEELGEEHEENDAEGEC